MGFVLYSAYISHLLFLPASILQNTRLVVLAEWNLQKKVFVNLPSHPHTPLKPLLFIGVSSVRVSVRV